MKTAKCEEKGCDFVATHATQNYANVLLGKHRAKVHGIRSPHQIKYGGPRKPEVEGEQPPKRGYQKKAALSVTLCPVCGCNIHAVNVAINLRR